MRTPVKKRLQFFAVAIIVYLLGFNFIPESLIYDGSVESIIPLLIAIFGYFIFLPILHWLWVIKAGKQKAWRIVLVFSLSSLCARYSFPTDVAQYFEFILFLRYPLIAILLIVELYLMVTIIKGLWQARKLSGDPRIHISKQYKDDDKKLAIALILAWEPASWYYAIPKFSKNHSQKLAQLATKSASRLHWMMLIFTCFFVGSVSYYLLVDWSELTALVVASFAFYSVIMSTANHRVARHYSVYTNGDSLVINNGFLGFSTINIDDIKLIEQGHWKKSVDKDQLMLGKGDTSNVQLTFNNEQFYSGTMGQFPEQILKIRLNVDQPENFVEAMNMLSVAAE
jgi:hypothetical protein